ncbi:alcohol dehydrogenase-like regulatory protein ErcA [Methanolobus profundi]|uniref:Alcohol dehydrogenase, class IV n=1 Tax=Methanolobus profundi TaxID=487685 RepID=A0A1I4SQN1_9EURY|nr:alcohol dehydrogenase-like regulatory protein ErcA [Methanolobus profundi]SFM66687.1 Alcohol dehydrogenase, class IV [Methanolobus profundi]
MAMKGVDDNGSVMHGTLMTRKFLAPEIILGDDSRELIGQYALSLSGKNIFLVSDPGVVKAGWTGEVADNLASAGLDVVTYDKVTPNPRSKEVMQGADVYIDEGCDLIVAVGGGSPMDCGKAIGAVASNHCHVLELEGVDEVQFPAPPIICIPTTAGSSADVSQFAIITDEEKKRKFAIISKAMLADLALIDPVITTSMSLELIADTGMDALCHAFESYVSNASSVITDMFALEATRLVSEYLPKAYDDPDDIVVREKVMLGSMYAGLAFSNASLGLVHAMAHSLGGYLDSAHGECNAQLLEHVVAYNYPQVPDRYRDLEAAMSGNSSSTDSGPDSLVGMIRGLNEHLEIEPGLSNIGVKEEDIDFLSHNALLDPCLATNPRPATLEDIEELYHGAL